MNKLYGNIGNKIKMLAKILGILFLAAGVILFVALIGDDETIAFTGLLGGVFCCISTWFMYGFGQLVDDVHEMRENGTGSADNEIPQI